MIVLKLGGSVVTEKDRPETLDGEALERAADAIADLAAGDPDGSAAPLAVVHGGGSFGHHHASERGVTTTSGTRDPDAVLAIHGAMTTLNRFVIDRLRQRDVPAIPVHPLSAGVRDADGDLTLPTGQVATLLEEGFVPVLHGDGVVQAGKGVTVLSGDEIVVELARELDADRIGLCSTVPGVLEGGRVLEHVSSYEDVAAVLEESESTDVTGGMAGKVRALLDLEASASIFGLEDLDAFLAGEDVGTTVD